MQDKGPYLCFADFEFTCGSPAHRLKSEMLSVGLVICDSEHNIIETFYCTARPNRFPKLTSQCKRLTHLTQSEINNSPDSEAVLERVTALMDKYSASELCVWGNFDKPGLVSDRRQHIQFRKPHHNIDAVCSAITDIQDRMVREMGLPQAVSIEELASVFGYIPSNGTFHNALNDAEALFTIHKAVVSGEFRSSQKFAELRQERLDRMAAVKKQTYDFLFVHEDGSQLDRIGRLFDKENPLETSIDTAFAFDEINKALDKVKQGKSKGKTILTFE